jgi:RNA 3'-phosphate cyclase
VRVKIVTAGSVGLVLQALLVALLKSKQKTTVEISGGATFGKFAPPTQYVQLVLLPLLRRMGHRGEIHIFSHGFYPVGGARVRMTTEAATDLSGLTLLDRGDIEVIDGVSIAATALKELKVAERQSDATKVALRNEGYDCRIDTEYVASRCPGSGVVLAAKTSTGCVFGADGLGERGKPAEVVGEQVARKLLRTIKSRATLDEYMGDQILPYLALAREESAVTAPRLTMHARTNMFVIKEFTTAEFSINQHGQNVRIGCVP